MHHHHPFPDERGTLVEIFTMVDLFLQGGAKQLQQITNLSAVIASDSITTVELAGLDDAA